MKLRSGTKPAIECRFLNMPAAFLQGRGAEPGCLPYQTGVSQAITTRAFIRSKDWIFCEEEGMRQTGNATIGLWLRDAHALEGQSVQMLTSQLPWQQMEWANQCRSHQRRRPEYPRCRSGTEPSKSSRAEAAPKVRPILITLKPCSVQQTRSNSAPRSNAALMDMGVSRPFRGAGREKDDAKLASREFETIQSEEWPHTLGTHEPFRSCDVGSLRASCGSST